jgi:regulator of protease activity HflC (stomatin/prohibitin superfamily)
MRSAVSAIGVIVIVWVVVMLLIAKSIVRVPHDSAFVVKTLGRVSGVLDSGLHLVVPFVNSIAARLSLLEQVLDVPLTTSNLRDGTPAAVRGTVTFRVSDPARAVSEVANFRAALVKLAASEWTRSLGASDSAGALEAVRGGESTIRTTAATWGLDVVAATPILMIGDDVSAAT